MTPGADASKPRLFGPYQLLDVLGEGGMGTVWLAKDPRHDRTVALKQLSPAAGRDGPMAERFRRECLALSKLNHPNVIRIHEAGQIGGQLFYTMEVVQGSSIEATVKEKGPLPPERAVAIARDLADGLCAVHAADLLHRDVKPGNVLVDRSGRAVLTDFGLVRVGWLSNLTQSNTFLGTYQYASPEVLAGLPPDVRSDLYQVGLLCYIMLTGQLLPFGKDLTDAARRIMAEQLPPASSVRREVPAAVSDVVAKAVARDPADRFATAAELRDALARCLEPQPDRAKAPAARKRRDAAPGPLLLSPVIVQLLLVLAGCTFLAALALRFPSARAPEIPLPVAARWLQSDWEAVSFRLGGPGAPPSKPQLSAVAARLRKADGLATALLPLLPEALAALPAERWTDLLLAARHPLELQAAARRAGLDYRTPAEDVVLAALRAQAADVGALPPAEAVARVKGWRERLLGEPALEKRLDALLAALGLPDAAALLATAGDLLLARDPDAPPAERTRLLEGLRRGPADAEAEARLARIFGPLTDDRAPAAWAAAAR